MSTVVENINPISVEIEPKHSVTSQTGAIVEIQEPEYIVHAQRKEYKVVSDNIYIPRLYDDAPQWMKDIIGTVVDVKTAVAVGNLDDALEALRTLATELEVAKNTYTMSIVSSNDIDERITTAIETLNSSLTAADATILNIAQTAVTPSEASAIAINTLSASLSASGEIGAFIANMNAAFADLDSATTQSINLMESAIEAEFSANATAINTIRTYVGVDEDGNSNGVGLLADVEILQKQNDGVIETVTGTYDVMVNPQDPNLAELVLTAEPYASWKAQDVSGIDTRLAHIGDVYIKYGITSNGAREYLASFKFIRTIVDASDAHKSTDADGFTWALIVDQASQDAYTQALNAYDLADNKRRVFTITPSGPYDEGDLWARVVNGSNQVWKCQVTREQLDYYNAADWNIASTDDTATVALQTGLADGTVTVKLTNAYVGTTPFLTYITNEIDSKVGVYSGETAPVAGQPSGVATNDIYLWFTTTSKVLADGTTQVYDITRTYKYSGSAWDEITTDSNITALADLADGKRTVFSGNTVPIEAVDRDIWIPSATNGSYLQGEIYQYNGTSWIVATKYSADLEAVRNNLQSQVDGKVDTYYQGTVPVGMTALNNGDYWYCTADVSTYKNGKVYKYVHATTSWVETADVSRYAFDTADGKAAIFTSTNAPTTGYKVNDMLIVIGSFNNGTTTFSDGVVLSSNANRVSGFTASDWVKKINDTEDLDAFVSTTYTPTVTNLQNQVDGKVESWYTVSTNDPKTAWIDAPTRAKHDGDMWYQTDTKLSYYYSSSTNAWNLIDDKKAIQALTNAAAAQTAANNAQTSANTANSLLADIANDNKLVPSEKVAVKKEWDIIKSEYTKNLAQGNVYGISTSSYTSAYNALSEYITPLLSSLTTTSDIVGITFRGMFKAYYDANVDLLNAVANKINAIADGKITSYYIDTFAALQTLSGGWTSTEKASNVGDLATVWNDSTLDNNGLWRWNGTSWVSARDKKLVALASAVTNLSTELSNGTSTWASADSVLENSLKTEISGEGARVESKFAYNSVVNINGIYKKSGFGLSTNYTSGNGTEANPYVSEFWIDASRLKFTNSAQTGQVAPFTIDATGATPQITFNGKVTFSAVDDVYSSNIEAVNIANPSYSTFDGLALPELAVTNGYLERRTDTAWIKYGGAGLMLWATALDAYVYLGKSSADYNISIPSNSNILVSAWVKANRAEAVAQLYVRTNDGVHTESTHDIGTNVWTRISNSFNSGSNTKMIIRLDCDGYIGTNIAMAIDGVMVEVTSNGTPSAFKKPVDFYSNNDLFAQRLGYTNYTAMVAAASSGKTIINGGYVNTSLINANSITANQINTVGLIAENISANEIVGKTITGSTINGASINGGVINGVSIAGGSVTINSSVAGNTGALSILSATSGSGTTSVSANFPTLLSMNTSSGFNQYRMCKYPQLVIISGIAMSFNALGTIYIEVSTNGGSSWTTLATSYINNNGAITYAHSNNNISDSIYRIRAAVGSGFTISVSGTLISSNV